MPGRVVTPRFKAPRAAQRARRARTDRAYSAWRKVVLAERPRCEVCQEHAADELHHRRRRSRGGALMCRDNVVAVCTRPWTRNCHARIHANPTWAREHGYLVFEGDPAWTDLGEPA